MGDAQPILRDVGVAAPDADQEATASEVVAFFFRGPEREERDTARYRRSVTPEFKETVAPTTPQFPPFVAIGIFSCARTALSRLVLQFFFHVRLAASVALTGQSETRIFRL